MAGRAAAVALALFATTAFGQDGSLVAQGKRVFNDQGCYGCHTMGKSGTPIASGDPGSLPRLDGPPVSAGSS